MDTLGSRDHATHVRTGVGQSVTDAATTGRAADSLTGATEFALLRSTLLVRLLDRDQTDALVAAAVAPPSNPLMSAAQKRLFRDFAAEMADAGPGVDLNDGDLRIRWLKHQLQGDLDEHLIGSALRAWSYAALAGPHDPYLDVHNVVGLLRGYDRERSPEYAAAALLLVEEAVQRCLQDAPDPRDAVLHFVIRVTEAGDAAPQVIEAGRRAGMPIGDLVDRLRAIQHIRGDINFTDGTASSPPPGMRSTFDSLAIGPEDALVQAIEAFDLSAHMASARTMSVLDQVLVRQAIASAVGSDGALTVAQLYALIDEVIRLNPNRHQTYHARGFVDAVCGRETSMRFPLANDERRAWVLCGALIGTLRDADGDAVARLITEHEDVFAVLLAKPELYAGAWLIEPLYPLLRDQGRFDALTSLLQHHLGNLSRAAQKRVISRAMSDARDLIVAGKSERAIDLLDAVGPALMQSNELALSIPEQSRFLQLALWRRGQAAMARGDFGNARKFFDDLLDNHLLPPALEAKVMADVGLAKAQIRRIHDVFPGDDQAASENVIASLANGIEEFLKAAELDESAAVRSRLCLAVLASESRSTADAIAHYRSFLQASMTEKPGYYGEHAQSWTRFLLALAIMEAGDRGDYQNAADELREAIRAAGFSPPVYMCARLAEAFVRAELNDAADTLLAIISRRDPLAAPRIVVDRRLEGCGQQARMSLLEYAQRPVLPIADRMTLLSRLLNAAVSSNDGTSLTCLSDALQNLGENDPGNCAAYVALATTALEQLTDESLVEAFDEAQLTLSKAAGHYEPVFARLSRRVEELLRSRETHDLDYAAEILDELDTLNASWVQDRVAPLRQRLTSALSSSAKESLDDLLQRRDSPVRIYVVGGGDRHRGYEATIRHNLPDHFPSGTVEVEFLFPGFSANWSPHLQTVKRNISRFDAVVLIYATRTVFGESVRELARAQEIPAYTCGRQGRGAVMHTIAKAVEQSLTRQTG